MNINKTVTVIDTYIHTLLCEIYEVSQVLTRPLIDSAQAISECLHRDKSGLANPWLARSRPRRLTGSLGVRLSSSCLY